MNARPKFLPAWVLPAALIVGGGLWVYGPALRGGWVWDDASEVTQNPVLRDPAGAGKIWVAPAGADYFPLKGTVQWLEWRAWGDRPLGYHVVSLGLHLASALLFWRVLRRLGVRLAWAGALLWTVHPLAVESVAWVAELKNTLSLPFFLGALLAYLDAEQAAEAGESAIGPYFLALGGFLLAMLSKSSVVMFPAVLLLHAWWRRGRVTGRDLGWTAPFFAISAILGAVTLWFQAHRARVTWGIPWEGIASRVAVAGRNFFFYLEKGLWPAHLLPLYPQGRIAGVTAGDLLPWAGLALLLVVLARSRARPSRAALFGVGFFLLNLLPVVGLVPMAYLHLAWAADHFAYVPLLGLAGLAAAALGCLRPRSAAVGLALALAVVLAVVARAHTGFFRDEESLWSRTLAGNPHASLALNNLGDVRSMQGRNGEALQLFARAALENPADADAQSNWGLALALAGRPAEAIPHDRAALRLNPLSARTYIQLGNALLALGRPAEAESPYREGLRLAPASAEAEGNLGVALMALGQASEARAHDAAAVRLDPAAFAARINLGNALARAGEPAAAIEQYQAALRLGADGAALHYNLAIALRLTGRRAEAIEQFEAVLRLQPGDGAALRQLAVLQSGG